MKNDPGFSLVEMMIALFILSFSILGLTSVTLKAIQVNGQNQLRNAAVRLTQEVSEELIAQSIDDISSTVDPEVRTVNIKGTDKPFSISREVTSQTSNLIQVELEVEYSYHGRNYSNKTVVYKHRAT